MGSPGFMPTATSVIHPNFRVVSLLMSHANCCRSESSTPWLKGSGTIDNIPCRSTCQSSTILIDNFDRQNLKKDLVIFGAGYLQTWSISLKTINAWEHLWLKRFDIMIIWLSHINVPSLCEVTVWKLSWSPKLVTMNVQASLCTSNYCLMKTWRLKTIIESQHLKLNCVPLVCQVLVWDQNTLNAKYLEVLHVGIPYLGRQISYGVSLSQLDHRDTT